MILINDNNKLNIDLKQSAKHDSISVFIMRMTSPETGKLRDFFTIMGSVIGNNNCFTRNDRSTNILTEF